MRQAKGDSHSHEKFSSTPVLVSTATAAVSSLHIRNGQHAPSGVNAGWDSVCRSQQNEQGQSWLLIDGSEVRCQRAF